MIYLISDRIDCSSWAGIEKLNVDKSIELISSWPVVQFDTETPGLDPRVVEKCWSFQFGYKDFATGEVTAIVVDLESVDALKFKSVLEKSYLILQNAKFDLKFLFNYGIVPLNVYDTMIIEQLLYLGYSPKKITYNLHDILFRHTGVELDKSFQKHIGTEGLNSEESVRYAAYDVLYLQDIRRSQIQIGKARNCLNAFTVENRFVPAIAYLEWCGVHLAEEKWKARMKKNEASLSSSLEKLNEYVTSNTALTEFVSTTSDSVGDENNLNQSLFCFEPQCIIDWNSPKQVIPVFKKLGFNTEIFDKNKGDDKDSISEKVLEFQTGIDDYFLDAYLDYKGYFKSVSSYGQGHLNQINPKTGRIHTEFRQIGTVTGRMASGSRKKNVDLAKLNKLHSEDVSYCNMQNLPARGDDGKEARACFTSIPGNVFISCDYSAEESRVQADVWNEKSLLDSFANGIDTHNLYAKLCFPDELKDVDVKDVKAKRPDLRQSAKSAEFAIGYGSDGSAIAKSIGMPVDKAKEMVSNILKGMPGMAKYKKDAGKFLKTHGYIVINETTGHRVYWPEWSEWKAVEDSMDRQFWTDFIAFHKGTDDSVCKKVTKHRKQGHDWFEKNVLNYPIQGGSAIVLKQAAADLFEWIVKNNLFGIVLFCVFVHDEIDCECPKEYSELVSEKIKSIMEKAAGKFYKRLPIPAECSIGDHWIH